MKVLMWVFVFLCIAFDVKAQSNFFQTHRLLFFFASTCSYCQQEAPVLRQWIDLHGAKVRAYSLNGESLPDFPETRIPNEDLIQTVFQHRAIRYPALFILNIDTKAIYRVAIGALNAMELDERLQRLLPKIIAYEERSVS